MNALHVVDLRLIPRGPRHETSKSPRAAYSPPSLMRNASTRLRSLAESWSRILPIFEIASIGVGAERAALPVVVSLVVPLVVVEDPELVEAVVVIVLCLVDELKRRDEYRHTVER